MPIQIGVLWSGFKLEAILEKLVLGQALLRNLPQETAQCRIAHTRGPPRHLNLALNSPAMARQKAPTHPIEAANRKDDEEFIRNYLKSRYGSIERRSNFGEPNSARARGHTHSTNTRNSPAWSNEWTHPKTSAKYSVQLSRSDALSREDFRACFNLIEETSSDDYKAGGGWHPRHKTREMKSEDLRYILVKNESEEVRAFTSLMPCFEEGEPVVYCYEIHLKPDLQG